MESDGGMPAGERAEAETAEAAAGRGPKCIWRRKAEADMLRQLRGESSHMRGYAGAAAGRGSRRIWLRQAGKGWNEMTEEMSIIGSEAYSAAKELLEAAGLERGEILVVGCSTSEVAGAGIGTFSSPELAEVVFGSIYQATQEAGVYLAAQCCEHLNRALILEKEAVLRYGCEAVNVVPQPKAGGSFATAAYKDFEHPVAVEHIRARAGMDIGDTLIGMHVTHQNRDALYNFQKTTISSEYYAPPKTERIHLW